MGFAPIDDPRIAIIVIVDRADVAVDYGSVTAAPYAKEILEQALVYMGCAKDLGENAVSDVMVPDVTGLSVNDALDALDEAGLDGVLDGVGARVIAQLPASGAEMAEGSLVMLYVDGAVLDADWVEVPDVTGLSVTEANRLIRSYGLKMTVSGSGIAVS